MRKFSSERLYTLTKILVIVVALICALLGYVNYIAIESYENIYQNASAKCEKEYEKDSNSIRLSMCYGFTPTTALELKREATRDSGMLFSFAIFLPLIFFSGRWIYKYLFPLKYKK